MENRVARAGRRRPGARRAWSTSRGGPFAKEAETTLALARRGAQAARPAGRRDEHHRRRRRWSISTSGCASCCAGRASPTSTPSSARRRSWRSRSRNLREGRYPADLFAHAPARGADGRRRGILAVRGRVLVGRVRELQIDDGHRAGAAAGAGARSPARRRRGDEAKARRRGRSGQSRTRPTTTRRRAASPRRSCRRSC